METNQTQDGDLTPDRARARAAMAAAIREVQGRRNYSNKRLGELAGVTKSVNNYYLKGERGIPAEEVIAYARALDVDPGELMARAAELMEEG